MRISSIILLISVIISCGINSNKDVTVCTCNKAEFIIHIDTININLKPYVNTASLTFFTHAIKYNEKYYCFFKENYASNDSKFSNHFFILSKDGIIEQKIILPNLLQNTYYFDLFVLNDSIYIKESENNRTFYLDNQKNELIEISEVDDVIF
jgi:hypothetical protein